MTTGPFSRSEYTYWPSSTKRKTFRTITWWRNGPGHRVPHPLTQARGQAFTAGTDAPNANAGYWAQNNATPSYWTSVSTALHNKCYAKFKEKAYETAAVGVDLAEMEQSASMIGKRAGQMWKAARALRRGRPFDFFHELGFPLKGWRPPNRSDPAKAANLWLEWHFGWDPLIKDIYDATKVLEGPTRDKTVTAQVSSQWMLNTDRSDLPDWYAITKLNGLLRERMGAKVRVTNPQLHKATQLGLTNPATVLWEIIPFSFVVDWFVPVGTFLESYSDWFGIDLVEPYTTISRWYYSEYEMWNRVPKRRDGYDVARGWRVVRSTSISGPSIYLRPWSNGKLKSDIIRAATSISVLIQQLEGMKNRRR